MNAALFHYPEAQDLLNKKAKLLMKKNEQLEKKRNDLIVINNPAPPTPHARLLDTVMKVVPPDSKTNRLLKYGSRGRPRRKVTPRNSLPSVRDFVLTSDSDDDSFETTKVVVHRSMT